MIYADSALFISAADPSINDDRYSLFILENLTDLYTSALTIDEVVWVISEKTSVHDGIAVGEKVLESGINILEADKSTAREALELMKQSRLKPRDAFHAATMRLHDITKIASEDKDFDKVPGIKRIWF